MGVIGDTLGSGPVKRLARVMVWWVGWYGVIRAIRVMGRRSRYIFESGDHMVSVMTGESGGEGAHRKARSKWRSQGQTFHH